MTGYYGGGIPWVKIADLTSSSGIVEQTEETLTEAGVEEIGGRLFPAGTILLAMYGSVGKVAIAGCRLSTNQAILGIEPLNDAEVHRAYLRRWLESQQTAFVASARGATQANISKTIVERVKIPLPSLDEQRRIAAILDKADAIRRKRKDAIVLTEELLRSTFLEMFGDPVTNPKGWRTSTLESLIAPHDSINYGVVQPGPDTENGIPIVRVGDFYGMSVRLSGLKRIAPTIEQQHARSRLRGDEILVACVGSIGKVALANHALAGANVARAVARIRCGTHVNRLFLAHYLCSTFVQSYFASETRTVSQPTLNIRQIEGTPVRLPPLAEQERFAEVASHAIALRERLSNGSQVAEQLFESLVYRAFRDEL